jgi:DNA repair protein RadA/Sms
MGAGGLTEVADASGLFLKDRKPGVAGSAVASVLEGRRPVALEVQTLVSKTAGGVPRRLANGIDPARLGMVVAVLERRANIPILVRDVWASVAGGLRATEPGIDLALAVALASSYRDRPVPEETAFIGEVGLAGEVRSVPGMQARVEEISRLGFRCVVAPPFPDNTSAIEMMSVTEVTQALSLL